VIDQPGCWPGSPRSRLSTGISISDVIQRERSAGRRAAHSVDHDAHEKDLRAAICEIDRLPYVRANRRSFRIERPKPMSHYAGQKVGIIERYQASLPVTDQTPIISLNEAIRRSSWRRPLPRNSDSKHPYLLQVRRANPTGSFKDRGMTMAILKAMGGGSKP